MTTGDRTKSRVTLERVDAEAETVARIFELFVDHGMTPKAIANDLNRPGGLPLSAHVDTSRNVRNAWAASMIRAMLKNQVYTGSYLFAGMVKCDADHGPASMHGKCRKGHHYYCCDYAARYSEARLDG